MNLTSLIIDDEPLARQVIRSHLKDYPDIQMIGECDNGRDCIDMIHNREPDIIFLDIHMPECSGIEMLEQLTYMPQVIFTTAYDEYAIQAFELNAVDYLLKPIDKNRFARCIERIREKSLRPDSAAESLMNLMRTMQKTDYPRRLLVPDQDQMIFIPVEEIDYIESADNYVSIVTPKNTYLLLQRLTELEDKLNPQHFFRIHRSYIVNVEKVKSIQTRMKSEVVLYSGQKLPLSRRRVHLFKENFGL